MTPFELDHFTGYLTTNDEYAAEIREQQERNRWHEAYQSLVIKIYPDWINGEPERHMWEVYRLEHKNGCLYIVEVRVDGGSESSFDSACSAAKYAAYEYADLVAKGE